MTTCFLWFFFLLVYVTLMLYSIWAYVLPMQVTRLIPDAKGTSCNQRLEKISGCEHSHILRVPFRTEHGILRQWISRFDVWPYLEKFAEVWMIFSGVTCLQNITQDIEL